MVDGVCKGKFIDFPEEGEFIFECVVAVIVHGCPGGIFSSTGIEPFLLLQAFVVYKAYTSKGLRQKRGLFVGRVYPIFICSVCHDPFLLVFVCIA